ncbi:unannotated protein [freshwater metagenome]|uniref:Unannotated protein n=1 Tax=freshwater metagenome TaxID=449393 RepID=A0A6J6GVV3_9ZZZZ
MRVVEKEGDRTADSRAWTKSIEFCVKQGSARFKCGAEAFLFTRNHGPHKVLLLDEIRVRLTHNLDSCVDECRCHKVGYVEKIRLANSPTNNATQHIAASFVRREDPIAHKEAHRARMLGEDAQRDVGTLPCPEARIGDALCGFDQWREHVGFKNRIDTLQYTKDAFEAGAGIDVLFRQLGVVTIGVTRKLHEDEIPNFEESFVAAGSGPPIGAIGRTLIDINLRTRTTRTGRPSRWAPPIVGIEELDAFGVYANFVAPNIGSFLIAQMAGDPEQFWIDTKEIGDHVPGHRDGFMFEVVTEREVAEHFEKRKMPGIAPDLFKIGILAASANTLLNCGGPTERWLLFAEEVGLERHHSSDSEEKIRIVRNEARRGNNRVASGLEERGECSAQLVRGHRVHDPLSLMTARSNLRFNSAARQAPRNHHQVPAALLRHGRRPLARQHGNLRRLQ